MLAAAAGVVVLTESLGHPLVTAPPPTAELQEVVSDPRAAARCPTAIPREGQDRAPADDGGGVAMPVTSNELFECPQAFDGRRVRYRGEVVGAVLERPRGFWLHLNDDVYGRDVGTLPAHSDYRGGNAGIGVFVPQDLASAITMVGGPAAIGDVLEVVGVYHRVDPTSGEVAVIRADSGEVTVTGEQLDRPVLRDRQLAAAILVPLALLVVVLERFWARNRSG